MGQISCELIGFSVKDFISEEISGHHYHVKILLHLTYSNLSKAYGVSWAKVVEKGKSTMEKEDRTNCPLEVVVGQEYSKATTGYILTFTRK